MTALEITHGPSEAIADAAGITWTHLDLEAGGRFETRMRALVDNGFAQLDSQGVRLQYDVLSQLDEDDRQLFDDLAPPAPLAVQLLDHGHLGASHFQVSLETYFGAKEVEVGWVGPFVDFQGKVYQMPWAAFYLKQQVEALNELPDEEKNDLNCALRAWGRTAELADAADAELSPYLDGERVVVADRVAPAFHEDDGGRLSVVPDFEGVSADEVKKEYLKQGETPGRLDIKEESGGRTRIVLSENVKEVLGGWMRFRRLSASERDDLLTHPMQLVPEGPAGEAVDLSLYGPRVRAIGEYGTSVTPFASTGQAWTDLGEEAPAHAPPDVVRGGIHIELPDGGLQRIDLATPKAVKDLRDQVQHAIEEGGNSIEIDGVTIPISPALVHDLERLRTEMLGEEDEPVDEPKPRPKGVGLLIYTNEEELEFEQNATKGEPLDTRSIQPPEFLSGVELKPHQQDGFGWLTNCYGRRMPGVFLADDMGLGKTLQALAFLASLIEGPLEKTLGSPQPPWDPILVVAPATLLPVWEEEVYRFFGGGSFEPILTLTTQEARKMRIASGRESHAGKPVLDVSRLRDNRMVLTSYQTLQAYGLSLGQLDWSVVIADEAQALKDPNTITSMVFKALKTGFRLAMTGTPVETRLLDVWNVFDALHPGLLGSAKEFSARYEPQEDGRIATTPALASELGDKIGIATGNPVHAGSRLLRRTKAQELPDLPSKTERRVDSVLSSRQRELYLAIAGGYSSGQGQGGALKTLQQLNRLCQHPRMVTGDVFEGTPASLVEESPKLRSLCEELDSVRKKNEKALVFAHYRDTQALLKRVIDDRYGLDAPILNGDKGGGSGRVHKARMDLIKRFQAAPGFGVLVVSPLVGGVGLTITEANHVFHYGRWWNPAREDQCTDRVYRIGQDRNVFVHRLVSADPEGRFSTFDELLDELLERRRAMAGSFLMPQGDEGLLARQLGDSIKAATEPAPEGRATVVLEGDRRIAGLGAEAFEAFCAALLEAQGFEAILTPYSNDGGVDVLGIRDGELALVQCKHTATGNKLSASVIEELDGAATFYRQKVIPDGVLGNRVLRPWVMTNLKASRPVKGAAGRADTRLVLATELDKMARSAAIGEGDVARWVSRRASSLRDVAAALTAAG